MYETKIKTALWWAYDIPGNIGWILYLIGFWKFAAKGGFSTNLPVGILLVIPALLMIIGIAELVSERSISLTESFRQYVSGAVLAS